MSSAVVLLSGGIDSTTAFYLAHVIHDRVHAVTFDYGQRNRDELRMAALHAELKKVDHQVIQLSHLQTASDYVPGRNIQFISIAAGIAEQVGAEDVYFGATGDAIGSTFPDAAPAALWGMYEVLQAGLEKPVTLQLPLINYSRVEIIRLGTSLGLDYRLTISCYTPVGGRACGSCEACTVRRESFRLAKVPDPTIYLPENMT